jgi:hypothetical protein
MAEEEGSALRSVLAFFKIGVDAKELEEGHKKVKSMGDELREFGKHLAEAFLVDKVKEFVESQIEAAVSLKTTALRLGTTTDELQALHLAAQEAGVSVGAMDVGLRFLNRNIANARSGSGTTAATFAKLGIALKDTEGRTRPAGDVMGDLADALKSIEDPARRTQVAMQLLGRGGAELIPLLAKGGAAFEAARKDVVALGGGISEGFVEQAHEAEVAGVKFDFALTGLKSTVVAAVLPALTSLAAIVTDVVVGFKKTLAEYPGLSRLFVFLGGGIVAAAAVSLGGLAVSMGILAVETLAAAAPWLLLALAIEEVVALVTGHDSLLQMIFGEGKPGEHTNAAKEKVDGVTKALRGVKSGSDEAKRALTGALREGEEGAKKTTDAMNELKRAMATVKESIREAKNVSKFNLGGVGANHITDIRGWKGVDQGGIEPMLDDEGNVDPRRQVPRGAPPVGVHAPGWNGLGGGLAPYRPAYLPKGGPGAAPSTGGPGIIINQHIENNFDISADGADGKTLRKAVGQGVADGTQRANDKALTAHRKP